MWHEITNNDELTAFMDKIWHFHDSCIKEIKYTSGAYVTEKLSMYPINEHRVLNVIIQRQSEKLSMIELEFKGLKYLKLFPNGEEYTCEIFESTMILKDGLIYWCDSADLCEAERQDYCGTLICANKLRWRSLEGCMGNSDFYVAVK